MVTAPFEAYIENVLYINITVHVCDMKKKVIIVGSDPDCVDISVGIDICGSSLLH